MTCCSLLEDFYDMQKSLCSGAEVDERARITVLQILTPLATKSEKRDDERNFKNKYTQIVY